jgi:hypothetical protein
MPVRNVPQNPVVAQRTADRKLDLEDAKAILASFGKSVSSEEMLQAAAALVPKGKYEISPDARSFLSGEVRTLKELRSQAEMQNAEVSRREKTLSAEEKAILKPGAATKTYGGTAVPEKVKEALNAMIKAGASAFDVAELSPKPEKDEHDPTQWALTGKWSPYPQEIAPTGNMAFSYTELTPDKIAKDMSTSKKEKVLVGFDTKSETDRRTGKSVTWQEPRYEERTMKGTGNIVTRYDEAGHPEMRALGEQGERYASNFAILADGTFHAVPAMRRTEEQPNLILTNPSLARGKRLLFNGHIEMRGGVVTSIGLSGRLQKLAADGDAKFVNPVKLLEAWGFQMSPNLQVHFEGSGNVKVDPQTQLITQG